MIPLYERFLPDFNKQSWENEKTAWQLEWDSIYANCRRILMSRQHFFSISEINASRLFPSLYFGLDFLIFSKKYQTWLEKELEKEDGLVQQLLLHEPRLEWAKFDGFTAVGPDECGYLYGLLLLKPRSPKLGIRQLTIVVDNSLKTVDVTHD